MQPQVKTDYSVTVYPGGEGWDESDPARIYFPDQETKEAFVKNEGKFCAKEYVTYNGADTGIDRESKRKELLKKRTFFAQRNGYAPAMKDRNMWFFQPPRDKVNA